jgi:endogenous inhibitor of DNA gyrase (YacG/DUF329 family)
MTRIPATCALCARPQSLRYRPFCSKRCADIDLQRWFAAGYVLPSIEEVPEKEGSGES